MKSMRVGGLRSVGLASCILGFVLSIHACNFKEEKDSDTDEVGSVDPAQPVTYAEVRTKIFEPSCVGCHSAAGGNLGAVNLESLASVRAQLAEINATSVLSRRMPPGDSLSNLQVSLLKAWIDQSGPE